jgi:hypothetical protein
VTHHEGGRVAFLSATVLAAVLAFVLPAAADDDDEWQSFEVEQVASGTYQARGTFVIAAPATAAFEAITDYEGIPRKAPSVKVSRVVSRDGSKVVVEQEIVAKALFFSKRIRLLLEIEETPLQKVEFRDTAEEDFDHYEGFWTIEEVSDSLRVSYGVDVKRGFSAPDFVARPFFRKQAESVMRTMREDILQRAASVPPP